jgi:hypothetical protein
MVVGREGKHTELWCRTSWKTSIWKTEKEISG